MLVGGAVALVSAAFLVGSTPDEEEFRFAVLSAWLHLGALAHGAYGFWTPLLGLGVPLPLTPNFVFHPLLPLLAVLSPVMWVRVLLLTHTVLGAVGMWRLTKTLDLSPPTRSVSVVTFLLAAPTQNYVLVDFWPSHFLVWTSAPWLLLMAWRLLDAEGRALRRRSIALGLCGGLVVANTNPGHVVVYGAVIFAVVAFNWRRIAARWRWVALAGLIAAAIASPNLVQVVREGQQFDPRLERSNDLPAPLPASAAWNTFLGPLTPPPSWPRDGVPAFSRTLFFGGPFAILCLFGSVRFARRRPELVLTVVVSATLLFTSALSARYFSARYQFRDPLTLAAIPLAGMALDWLLGHRRWRIVGVAAVVLQCSVLTAAAWPLLARTWDDEGLDALSFRGATGDARIAGLLVKLMPGPGRLVFTAAVDREIYLRELLPEGLGVNALAYRGVPVVNGVFKGVSTAAVSPDEHMFYGRISAPNLLVESDAALDVLGVRYVLANTDETVAPGLRERARVPKLDGSRFILYENSRAWPDGFVLDLAAEQIDLAFRPRCSNSRLMCRDFEPLIGRRVERGVQVTTRDDRVDVQLSHGDQSSLLVVSQMFRPEWVATGDGHPLTTVPVFGGLIGVRLPGGITSVHLRYRPTVLMFATGLAWLAIVASLGGLVMFR